MKRALVTGITGQDGLYLAELLLDKGYEVYGLVRGQNNPKLPLLQELLPDVKVLTGDLLDLSSLMRAFTRAQPDEVYNLGAISFVAYSWENAHLTSDVTGMGVLNMLEATRLHCGEDLTRVRFYQASSSEMFGKVQQVPQTEETLLWPRSPYGVAKVFGHYMTINYRESYGMHASSGILFNHESPRRGPEFVTRKVTTAVARISLGLQESVSLGNLEADPGDGGFRHVGMDDWEPRVVQDPRFFRPAEVDLLVGDASKARKVLGWEPEVDFQGLVTMMVDSDLEEQRRLQG